jgi:TatD DNase family protein
MLIDTHCHVYSDQFDSDRPATLERAGAAGVARMIAIGYDLPSSRAALALAQDSPLVWASAGIQPHYAQTTGEAELAELRGMLAQPRVVALGEIGLDYYHDRAPHDLQEALFRRQLALARELELPVVIHSRDAREDTVRILRDAARGQPGVMHSFSGDWEYAEACLEVGFYLSFSGPLTFKKAAELHEVARRAPLDRILIETDAPYLTPHPFRGKRNEPAYVRYVAAALADLRGLSLDQVAAATTANAERLFSRLSAGSDR